MKKKLFSVFIALVLALSLCLVMAVPVAAGTAAGVILIGDGIAEWSIGQFHSGDYSVKLMTTPPDWGNWAGLQIPYGNPLSTFITTGEGDDAVLDVSQTNFWYHMEAVEGQVPIMSLVFENQGVGSDETWKLILEDELPTWETGLDDWVQMLDAFTTAHLWKLAGPSQWDGTEWGATPLYEELGWWQTNETSPIKDVTVAYVELSIGTQAAIVYIDDVTINGDTYDLEPATGTVGVTASYQIAPPPVIGIEVLPITVNFGDVIPGEATTGAETVTVTNTGDIAVNLTASIENESHPPVYANGLAITWVPAPPDGVAVDDTATASLVLTVPAGTAPGIYTATLVFWAEAVTLP